MSGDQGTPARAILCTGNRHKLEELDELLPLELEALPDGVMLPPETGTTFEQNARIKACGGAEALPGAWVIADDSGLEVDALDGAPGVYSARFAGPDASDTENNLRLLEQLDHVSDPELRSARFVCVLVALSPSGEEFVASATVEGSIALTESGAHGFGYDPLFVPQGFDATFGVLGADVKQRLSHRARAARALAAQLAQVAT